MDGCKSCGMVYSLFFRVQFHAKGCPEAVKSAPAKPNA